jgi:hypothetical protein
MFAPNHRFHHRFQQGVVPHGSGIYNLHASVTGATTPGVFGATASGSLPHQGRNGAVKLIGNVLVVVGLGALLVAGGCARKIGDGCSTSTDCDPNGNRICDLSQPGGYCTLDGCDDKSCPEDSICIRTFPEQYLSRPCDPKCEDVDCPDGTRTNDCTDDEICLDSGVCARQAFERRYCAHACSDNGDCRGGYACRLGGTRGNMTLLTPPNPTARFCAKNVE